MELNTYEIVRYREKCLSGCKDRKRGFYYWFYATTVEIYEDIISEIKQKIAEEKIRTPNYFELCNELAFITTRYGSMKNKMIKYNRRNNNE